MLVELLNRSDVREIAAWLEVALSEAAELPSAADESDPYYRVGVELDERLIAILGEAEAAMVADALLG